MEKRSCERIPASIEISYNLWNPLVWKKKYSGIIKNLSEKGMFIRTMTSTFPLDSLLELYIPFRDQELFIPAKNSTIIWRQLLPDQSCDSIGLELTDPPREYLELIDSLKASS